MVATLKITFTGSSFSDGIITSLSWLHRGILAAEKEATVLSDTLIFLSIEIRFRIMLQLLISTGDLWGRICLEVSAYTTICPAPLLTVFSHHLLWNVDTCMKFGDKHLRMTLKYFIWAWTYGSMVKSNCCSFRTPRFHSRYLYDSS